MRVCLSQINAVLHAIHLHPQVSLCSPYVPSIMKIHLLHHNVAAADTAPEALKAALFVTLTSTGYIHSMYFAQPAIEHKTSAFAP